MNHLLCFSFFLAVVPSFRTQLICDSMPAETFAYIGKIQSYDKLISVFWDVLIILCHLICCFLSIEVLLIIFSISAYFVPLVYTVNAVFSLLSDKIDYLSEETGSI